MTNWDFLTAELAALEHEGLLSQTRTVESAQGAWVTVDGKRVFNLCANNYMGLANHPRLREAAHAAIERFGVGTAAVRSIAGTLSLHHELEQQLAAFKGVEATLALQSGFNANLAVIPALVMDGEIAPLPRIVEVAAPHEALVMVDDAHGEGVLGLGSRGISHHFGLLGQVDVEVGTLSKAFGVIGGYVAGRQVLIDYLKQRARPYLFSSATTAADVAACLAAVALLQESQDKVEQLWENTRFFQERMRALGFDLGHTQTPITPVMIGEAQCAKRLSPQLFDAGVFVQAVAFPTVPRGQRACA
jgi:glycine C-acetyltransferase